MGMGGTEYEIILTDDAGAPLVELSGIAGFADAIWFDAPKAANQSVRFQLGIPPNFDDRLFEVDQMLQFWRRPRGRGGVKRLWQVYFLRRWEIGFLGEKEHMILSGPDPKDLLRRRHVIGFAGSTYATKSDKADDMMKEVVTESQSDAVPPVPTSGTRAFPDFSVAPDAGLGPTINRKFAWGRLLHSGGSGVLPSIAEIAREKSGLEVFFDVVPRVTGNGIAFQFVTNIGQPARDVSDDVVFSRSRGNLQDPTLVIDYLEEVNASYVAGIGQNDKRKVTQGYDVARVGASRYNRCEDVKQDNNLDSFELRRDAARGVLEKGLPRVIFSGIPLDTKGARFGTDWDYGYRVSAEYRSYEFPVIIRAVMLQHRGKKEGIVTRLDFDGTWPL